jgi:predicted NodU family carbamoyl transferase
LVLGLNKYSHDAAACIVDANTGAVLFAGEKERLTRKKHDAGAVLFAASVASVVSFAFHGSASSKAI